MEEDPSGGASVGANDHAVLVAWSHRRRSPTRQFAALVLEGSRVRLMDADGETLLEADGSALRADIVSPTQVELHAPDGTVRYLVGPLPQWGKRGRGAELVSRYGAQLTPDTELVQPEGRLSRFMITPATSQLRRLRQWPPVLMALLRSRGVAALDDGLHAPSASEDGLGQ
ncbi:MAG: hypothetical protein WAU75_00485 [Solirubrobacteraceae bacterium]